jgi:hypothetical protein
MNGFILTAALLATLPVDDGVLRDRCDVLEVNHYFDDEARPVFTQLLFLDWCPRASCHHCADWRLMKQGTDQFNRWQITIHKEYATGDWVATWTDDAGAREVRAKQWRESFTQHDPEMTERERWPVDQRRKLRSKPITSQSVLREAME